MSSALLIRLRPAGPWRYGPGDGARDRVDALYRSDRLFSALSQAMQHLGHLNEWLDATARSPHSAVAFSSLFPFQADTLFAPPPRTLWPPAVAALRTPSPVFLTKVRWSVAQFVPVPLIESLMLGNQISADQWIADAESGCLLRRDRPQSSPFRTVVRARVPVDRLTNRSADGHSMACVEFEAGAGLWAVALFTDSGAETAWSERVQAAFRLLGDTGFGGSRSAGWGQAPSPECQVGDWPGLLFPKLAHGSRNGAADRLSPLHWLLSIYTPAPDDSVNWAEGKYTLTVRGGRVESQAGRGAQKKLVRMVTEGSVVSAPVSPKGRAVDVAPDGFAHPVYRAGFALALVLPVAHVREETPEQGATEGVTEADTDVAPAALAAGGVSANVTVEREAPPEASELVTPAREAAERVEAAEHLEAADLVDTSASSFELARNVTEVEGVVEIPGAPSDATSVTTERDAEITEHDSAPATTSEASTEAETPISTQITTDRDEAGDHEL